MTKTLCWICGKDPVSETGRSTHGMCGACAMVSGLAMLHGNAGAAVIMKGMMAYAKTKGSHEVKSAAANAAFEKANAELKQMQDDEVTS